MVRQLFFIFILFYSFRTFSEVEAPNYNFSMDTLDLFKPGSAKDAIKQKYGDGELMENASDLSVVKYQITYQNYKFPVFVQFYKNEVLDYFAKLPSYFLHDVFHQAIINRLGKQDQYFKKENSAVYIWNNKNSVKFTYSASCTITCFPVYYTAQTLTAPKEAASYKPLLEKFKDSSKQGSSFFSKPE